MRSLVKLQIETIEKVVTLLKSYDGVEAIFLMGSHVAEDASAFSDIDLGFVFSDPARPHKEEILQEIAALYPTLCVLWLFDNLGLFLYANGIRLDVDFLTQEVVQSWDLSGVKMLYDPDGKYADQLPKPDDPAPRPAWRDEDGDMIDWFFWMFRQTYCYIRRGETSAKRRFDKLYNAQTSLSSIRAKLLEMRVYLHGTWDYMQQLDPAFADQMALTFCDNNPVNMTTATRILYDLFERIALAYCEKEHKTFPSEKVMIMRQLFDDFDASDS